MKSWPEGGVKSLKPLGLAYNRHGDLVRGNSIGSRALGVDIVKPVVFVHTNDKQLFGAKLAAYSLKARSKHPDRFEVKLLRLEETPHLYHREGRDYLRKGKVATRQTTICSRSVPCE